MNKPDFDICLTETQTIALQVLAGDEATPLRLQIGDGHSGYGLYASLVEYPEEGAEFIAPIETPKGQKQ